MANTLTPAQVNSFLKANGLSGDATKGTAAAAIAKASPAVQAAFNSYSSSGGKTTAKAAAPLSTMVEPPKAATASNATLDAQKVNAFLQAAGLQGDATKGTAQAAINAAPPEIKAAWEAFSSSGGKNTDVLLNYLVTKEVQTQKNDPSYGSLAKAPYETFKPFAEKAPEYKPFAMSDFVASPDYQFRLDEGNKAIDRAGSARGNFYSGGALKEAAKFGSDLASGEYNNARNNYVQDYGIKAGAYGDKYNRYNQDFSTGYGQASNDSNTLYNRYAGMAGAGSGTANAAVANNANNASAVGNIYGQTANAKAAAGIAGSNNITQLLANSFGNSSYGKPKYDQNTGARIS